MADTGTSSIFIDENTERKEYEMYENARRRTLIRYTSGILIRPVFSSMRIEDVPVSATTIPTYYVGFSVYAAVASDLITVVEKTFQVLNVAHSSTQYIELGHSAATYWSMCDGMAGHVTTGALA